ncbi:MAG TPA: hypothetical protein VFZ77_23165 [Acidimicrobiales bacterium]
MAASDDQPSTPEGGDRAPAPSRRRRARVRGAAALGAAAAVVAGLVAWREPPPPPDGLVILYGDSLSTEAAGAFTDELARTTEAEVVARLLPGASPCDAAGTMREDLALEADVVVIQYVGNTTSPCMREGGARPTGRALGERIVADVEAAATMFAEAGTRVVLVGGPHAPGLPAGDATLDIAEAYTRIVDEWPGELGRIRYADAAATVTGPDRRFVERLPCRADEGPQQGCRGGQVVVRSADGVHFCPAPPEGLRCPVPSPGARRFGTEMARVVRMALDPGY